MAQGYYNLQEAAKVLGVSVEDLNQMAQKREVRAFADNGSWKFRQQDIDELHRRRMMTSDAEIQLPKGFTDQPTIENIIEDDDDQVVLDESALSGIGIGGTDADVTVVGMRGSQPESQVLILSDDEGPRPKAAVTPSAPTPPPAKPAAPPAAAEEHDIDLGDDLISAPTSSGVVLSFEESGISPSPEAEEEIEDLHAEAGESLDFDLDDESSAPVASAKPKTPAPKRPMTPPPSRPKTPAPGKASTAGSTPTIAHDDLGLGESGSDLNLESASEPDFDLSALDSADDIPLSGPISGAAPKKTASGSGNLDFDDNFDLAGDEDIRLGDSPSDSDITGSGPSSGINLASPADSGLSLEDEEDSLGSEFELSLDSDEGEMDHDLPEFKDDDEEDAGRTMTAKRGAAGGAEVHESEDSDFELDMEEDEFEGEEESGSEIVAIDEEEDEEAEDEEEEEDEEYEPAAVGMVAAEQSWPGWMVVPLSMTILLLGLVGVMMLEIMRNTWSHQQPYTLTATVIQWVKQMGEAVGL